MGVSQNKNCNTMAMIWPTSRIKTFMTPKNSPNPTASIIVMTDKIGKKIKFAPAKCPKKANTTAIAANKIRLFIAELKTTVAGRTIFGKDIFLIMLALSVKMPIQREKISLKSIQQSIPLIR